MVMSMSLTICHRCGVDISAAGYCIDGEAMCRPCYRNERPVQCALEFPQAVAS